MQYYGQQLYCERFYLDRSSYGPRFSAVDYDKSIKDPNMSIREYWNASINQKNGIPNLTRWKHKLVVFRNDPEQTEVDPN